MIEVERVTKRFGRFVALDAVSMGVERGESVALWGPNGAGKTTLLRCLLGLYRFEGRIRVDGLDARREGRLARSRMGHVPQQLAFDGDRSAVEVLSLVARLRGAPPRAAASLLEGVGLAGRAESRVGTLSGGMRQKLAVAAALVGDPPVLLLDEPTANLDVGARADLLALLSGLRAGGRTLLLTTHRLDEVQRLADRVVVLDGGRVRTTCPAARLPEVVGLRTRVVLWLHEGETPRGVAALERAGVAVEARGDVLLAAVPPPERARPLAILAAAGISVRDVQMEDLDPERTTSPQGTHPEEAP